MEKRISVVKTHSVTISFPGDVIAVNPDDYIARLEVDLDEYSTLVTYAFENTEEEAKRIAEERLEIYLGKMGYETQDTIHTL